MKPLNKKARRKPILKVLGLFLVALIIAIFLSAMTIMKPQLSENKCQKDLNELMVSLKFQREVLTQDVNNTLNKLSQIPTYQVDGENLEVLNNDVGATISNLNGEIQNLNLIDTILYKAVVQSLSDLQIAYNKQLDLGESSTDLNEMRTELQLCKTEKRQLENEVRNLKASAASAGDCSKYINQLAEAERTVAQNELEIRALKNEIAKLRNQ